MHTWARSSLFFVGGFWAATVLAGAVAIYGFNYFELAWGRGPSLQTYTWIATLGAIVSVLPAGFGFRLGSRNGPAPGPLLSAICGAALLLVLWLIALVVPDRMPTAPIMLLLIITAAFCLAYLASVGKRRYASGPSNKRWKGP